MSGKTKKQKKQRAKIQQRERELLARKPKKIVADQPEDVLGNNGDPPPPNVNEDAQKDEAMVKLQAELKSGNYHGVEPEPKPFDPKSVVANILKKKDGA